MRSRHTDECAIAVMAKASIPGKAKTRLVPPLSPEEAAEFNTAFIRDIAQSLSSAGRDAAIKPYIAFAPAGQKHFFEAILPSTIGLMETVAPTFGDCLFKAVSTLLDEGYQSACVVNSDSPTLPRAYLTTAATALAADGERIVIGPSTDGGYYLLGMKAAHRRLFEDINWSTERVFQQTMDRAAELALPVIVLPTWYDVDDAESLRTLADELLHGNCFRRTGAEPVPAAHSRELLVRLMRSHGLVQRLGLATSIDRVA